MACPSRTSPRGAEARAEMARANASVQAVGWAPEALTRLQWGPGAPGRIARLGRGRHGSQRTNPRCEPPRSRRGIVRRLVMQEGYEIGVPTYEGDTKQRPSARCRHVQRNRLSNARC